MPEDSSPDTSPEDYDPTLAELGEDGILAELLPLIRLRGDVQIGPGDDAALVNSRIVVTTDVLVEGVDFRLDWSTPRDAGWKAAAQNLADVAAMGAVPTGLVVAMVAPKETPLSVAKGVMQGLTAACETLGGCVIGGDLSHGPALIISVTAIGDLSVRPPIERRGAKPGDVVAVRGRNGWSAAGLALLEHGGVEHPDAEFAIALHRRPYPPVRSGPYAAKAGAHAMIDTSDGLLRDLGRIARASDVVIELDTAAPALQEQIQKLTGLATALGDPQLAATWVLTGGEDHCLVATFATKKPLPQGFLPIGTVRDLKNGEEPEVLVDGVVPTALGYDHFGG